MRDVQLHRHVAARGDARCRDGFRSDWQCGEAIAGLAVAAAAAGERERTDQAHCCRAQDHRDRRSRRRVESTTGPDNLHLRAFAARTGFDAARFGAQSARKPAAQYGTSRSWTLSRSLERQAPPDNLSMRPVSANVSVSAPERKW